MPRKSTDREIEIKLRLDSALAGKRLLRRLGLTILKRRAFEINVIFDTADRALRRSRKLLRLRQTGRRHTLTIKGPAAAGAYKSREELQGEFSDALSTMRILE